jgi:hypothetical protein
MARWLWQELNMSAENDSPAAQQEDRSLSTEDLLVAASDPNLPEDSALMLLKRLTLPSAVIEKIAKNPRLSKSRKVQLALVEHPRTPRHATISALRDLFTFDLMRVALRPAIAADIKIAAEEALLHRLEMLSSGEKSSLARRASGRIASELLLDSEARVVGAALESSRLTEALLVKTLMRHNSSERLATAVRVHTKWSLRPEVQQALIRRQERDAARQPSAETKSLPESD